MLGLPQVSLPPRAQRQLRQYQSKIDAIASYEQRVAAAKSQFAKTNNTGNKTFSTVKQVLTQLCSGARRCMYCEDSCADEVEHIKSKDLFPEFVFVWENYLYSCGRCNGPKNNRHAIFSRATGRKIDVTRQRGAPIVPPEEGDPLLIDPRSEDPLRYMELDLTDTFYFLPTAIPDSKDYQRAEYTIELLRLNAREELCMARQEAYDSYRARLTEYIRWRNEGKADSELKQRIHALQRMGHPTVWYEMKRQQYMLPDLRPLFAEAPEALVW